MESNPITLIIQAHGSEDLNVGLIANRVQLLSVSGAPGELGIMSFCKDKNGKLSSLDINVMNMLKDAYSKRGSLFQHFMFNDVLINKDDPPGILQLEYENCGVTFDKNGGFKPTKPFSERRFYFRPNPHENCEKCIYGEGSAKCERCIPIRDSSKKMSPEYGLSIICTEIPEDYRHSLIGTERERANLHLNLPTRNYWRNRIPRTSTQCITNFDKMFDTNEINLSELLTIFREMGYEDIYIIDPTCRDCDSSNPSRGRLNWHSAYEQVAYENTKIKREAFKSLETTLDIITYNRNTQNNRNSRTNRGSIQTPNSLIIQQSSRNPNSTYLYQVSTGIAITLATFLALFAYMSRQQSGGKKTYKNKKNIFSTSMKKGNNPKYTRYNRPSSR
jgi:hypothetical protein